jgi:hypothetical protein
MISFRETILLQAAVVLSLLAGCSTIDREVSEREKVIDLETIARLSDIDKRSVALKSRITEMSDDAQRTIERDRHVYGVSGGSVDEEKRVVQRRADLLKRRVDIQVDSLKQQLLWNADNLKEKIEENAAAAAAASSKH